MKRKQIAALVTALVGIGIIFYYMSVVFAGDQYRIIGGAYVMTIEIFLLALAAIILLSFQQTKDIGQGMMIGTGITLLIGFGICTAV